ncbi:unnamed protein product [Fusarium langsethiae]|nr:unnamed protein product [Fusarium langsethiae]
MPSEQVKRYVIVGMGVRSAMYYQAIIQDFKDVAKLVGICDTNQTRMDVANDHIVELGGEKVQTYKDTDFDKMVQEQKADVVIVTTIDLFHHHYCIRAMELGCDAITEKPMTIDEHKLQQMVDAEKKTGKQVRVLFNYRYAPHHTKVRELIDSGVIGEISTLNTEPELVYCLGDLRFYGKENAEKRGEKNLGERYKNNDDAKNDPFAFQLDDNERMKKLYLNAEHEDGYIRDRNCFGEGITIEDNLSMIIKYKNRAVMTYNTYAYAPWEGYRCVFNGTKGRIEINVVESGYNPLGDPVTKDDSGEDEKYIQGGVEQTKIVVYPMFDKPYVVDVVKQEGGHGGGDPVLLKDVILGDQKDSFKRAAYIRDGGNAVLVGVGANHSMKSGMPVKVQDLVKW